MTLVRADVAAYLDTQFSTLAATAGQDSDPLIGYEPDIDLAYRKLGVARANLATATVEDSQEDALFTLGEYYAARRLWRQLVAMVNVKVGDSSFDYKQVIVSAKELMVDAAAKATSLGLDVSVDGWSMGFLNLDFLEPEFVP